MDLHEAVSAVKALAIQLGRTPTKADFISNCRGAEGILRKCGGFAVILKAAGMDTFDDRRGRKLTNDIFKKDISDVLSSYQPAPKKIPANTKKILVIPDTHFPFVDNRVLEAIYQFIKLNTPDFVIQIGDLYDLFAYSSFPKSANTYSPQDEVSLARAGAEKMWATIRELCPNAELIQMVGNHDIRPLKTTLSSLPALEHIIEKYLHELMTFPGVKLISDHREPYIIGDIQFIHGHATGMGKHRDYFQMNTVIGHQHVMHITHRTTANGTLFEMCVGLAGDATSKVFSYTPNKVQNWQTGFGWIDIWGPRTILV